MPKKDKKNKKRRKTKKKEGILKRTGRYLNEVRIEHGWSILGHVASIGVGVAVGRTLPR